MTTKLAGGKITGLLALTLEAQVALEVGDPVMVTGNYECGLNDGTKPCIGFVSVKNVKRQAGAFPVALVPGQVTVEARGVMVRKIKSAGALAAGIAVGTNGAQKLAADGAGVAHVGVSLMAATAVDQWLDTLIGCV